VSKECLTELLVEKITPTFVFIKNLMVGRGGEECRELTQSVNSTHPLKWGTTEWVEENYVTDSEEQRLFSFLG